MSRPVKEPTSTRTYHAPRRTAAAAETRHAILRAAKEEFEARGWAATTIRSIARRAGVSPKTVEALFATKPALLEATLLAALSADAADTDTRDVVLPEGILELNTEAVRKVTAAPDAATALELLAALISETSARIERIFWAVETAVPSDERLAEIWARLIDGWLFGNRWAAETVLQKPGIRPDLTLREAEETLLIPDWNTHRTLTTTGALTPEEVQAWTARYYRRMLLA
jgi:AcrR family transcriptional regulator